MMAGGRPRRQEAFCDICDTYAERVFLKKHQKAPKSATERPGLLGFCGMGGALRDCWVFFRALGRFWGHGCASGGLGDQVFRMTRWSGGMVGAVSGYLCIQHVREVGENRKGWADSKKVSAMLTGLDDPPLSGEAGK